LSWLIVSAIFAGAYIFVPDTVGVVIHMDASIRFGKPCRVAVESIASLAVFENDLQSLRFRKYEGVSGSELAGASSRDDATVEFGNRKANAPFPTNFHLRATSRCIPIALH